MIFAGLSNVAKGRLTRFAAALVCVAPLAACSSFDVNDYNPFAPEKYKMKVEPDTPPATFYDQGLARLSKDDGSGAAKKFTDLG
jgi:outer membrane protein assembly factor BamD (BamD/ComL family)